MGVSIWVRPGTIKTPKGAAVDLTPGFRSQAASVIQEYFGAPPIEILVEARSELSVLAAGASVYTTENIFSVILDMLNEHGVVTVGMDY